MLLTLSRKCMTGEWRVIKDKEMRSYRDSRGGREQDERMRREGVD